MSIFFQNQKHEKQTPRYQRTSNLKKFSSLGAKNTKKSLWSTELGTYRLLLIIVNFIIVAVGLFFVLEVSSIESYNKTADMSRFIIKQLLGGGLGLVAFFITSQIPRKWWLKLAPIFYFLSLVMLVLVLVSPFAQDAKGASRWLNLGFIQFQPVEIIKFFLIIFFAWLLGKKRGETVNSLRECDHAYSRLAIQNHHHQTEFSNSNSRRLFQKQLENTKLRLPAWLMEADGTAPSPWLIIILLALPLILIFLQPNFSAVVMIASIIMLMYFLAGVSWKVLGTIMIVGVITLTTLFMTADYRQARLETFWGSDCSAEQIDTQDWQICQIKMALGRGGWFGVGIGASKQKFAYVPEASSDSIVAIVGEEIGFFGLTIIMLLYAFYFYCAWQIIRQAKLTQAERLMGYGLWIWLAIQTLMNFGVITELIPLTGVPLPFFSYGSTSLVMSLVVSGVLAGLAKPPAKS